MFHVVWFDPHHNMYPSDNYGGLKKIVPPSTCCKDRDSEVALLKKQLNEAKREVEIWQKYAEDIEQSNRNS